MKTIMRVMTLILLFLTAAGMVQAVAIFTQYLAVAGEEDVSLDMGVIYLMVTPFCLLASIFMAAGVHKMAQGLEGGFKLVLAYAFLILAAVDSLVYIPVRYEISMVTSLFILSAIELVCLIILFMYFQGMGPKALALFGAIMLLLCFGLELRSAILYVWNSDLYFYNLYYLNKAICNFLFALMGVFLVAGLEINLLKKKG